MKISFIISLLLLNIFLVNAQAIKYSPENPKSGDTIKFSYNPTSTNLNLDFEIECLSVSFTTDFTSKNKKIPLSEKDGLWIGEVITTENTTFVALGFSSKELKDKSEYFIKLTSNNQIPAQAYLSEGYLVGSGRGNALLGIETDTKRALGLYEKAYSIDSNTRNISENSYYTILYKADKIRGKNEIDSKINQINKSGTNSEEDLLTIRSLYTIQNDKVAADSITQLIIKNNPTGVLAYKSDLNSFIRLSDPSQAEDFGLKMISKYKLEENPKSSQDADMIYSFIAEKYVITNDYPNFIKYADLVKNKASVPLLYNKFVTNWLNNNDGTNDQIIELTQNGLKIINELKTQPRPAQYPSDEIYISSLENAESALSDTYANIENRLNNFKEAVSYQERALALSKDKNIVLKEHYVTYLMNDKNYQKAYSLAEESIKTGLASDSLKNNFERLFKILNKEGSAKEYISNLESNSDEKLLSIWKTKMINEPAPSFEAKNLKGEVVKLSDLKGKIVILDFWATWCGPCKKSFPGMNKARIKYANNPNVVFLFVNTWEDMKDREKVVADFIAKNNYDFNVLIDKKSQNDPSKFQMVNDYQVKAIPNKFIIDGRGNIRFNITGSSASEVDIVNEIDAMINLILKD
ncbi:redoxin domain-containing protein [Sphingobacterium hungaricum]